MISGKSAKKSKKERDHEFYKWFELHLFRPKARAYYQRKAQKTDRMVAYRALSHKLARAAYFIMRDQVPFDPEKLFG